MDSSFVIIAVFMLVAMMADDFQKQHRFRTALPDKEMKKCKNHIVCGQEDPEPVMYHRGGWCVACVALIKELD